MGFKPGSFTKNFGWSQYGPGFIGLHQTIRNAIVDPTAPVTREEFRTNCGIADDNQQLIPINFYLHNTLKGNINYITNDELVRYALNFEYSHLFDLLSLFALHLNMAGKRVRNAGYSNPTGFLNHYVKNVLWESGGWKSRNLKIDKIEQHFNEILDARDNTIRKCSTNYMYLFDIAKLKGQGTGNINTEYKRWSREAHFMQFDRLTVDLKQQPYADKKLLIKHAKDNETYKLLGASKFDIDYTDDIANEYIGLGGLGRKVLLERAEADDSEVQVEVDLRKPVSVNEFWTDEGEIDEGSAVDRKTRNSKSQIRNLAFVKEMKVLYKNACMMCGDKVVIDVKPTKYYSEAAHIKPLGEPHNGPDSKKNMLILCPIHHLQFDRGLLTLESKGDGKFIIKSKIHGDSLENKVLTLKGRHSISKVFADYHRKFWDK